MEHLLKDQIAIVTGGTAGIGKAIAQRFVEEGAKVILFGTNAERGEEALKEIQSLTNKNGVHFVQVNVAHTAEVDQAMKTILDREGHVDILVNNAGITCDKLLMKWKKRIGIRSWK